MFHNDIALMQEDSTKLYLEQPRIHLEQMLSTSPVLDLCNDIQKSNYLALRLYHLCYASLLPDKVFFLESTVLKKINC